MRADPASARLSDSATNACRYRPRDLLAHRGPMLLLDEILEHDTNSLRAAIDVQAGKPYCTDTGTPGWVGLEWLAQTAGAWAGAWQLQHGEAVDIGFLAGARRYRSDAHFGPGRVIAEVVVVLFDHASRIAVLDGMLRRPQAAGETLASARIKVFQPPDVAAFLAGQGGTRR